MSIGLDTLAVLRRHGLEPASVDIDTDCALTPALRRRVAALNAHSGDACWNAVIGRAETLGCVDLRPVLGLVCTVGGVDAARVAAVGRACEDAGAARVVACTYRKTLRGRDLVVELVHANDTTGALAHG